MLIVDNSLQQLLQVFLNNFSNIRVNDHSDYFWR